MIVDSWKMDTSMEASLSLVAVVFAAAVRLLVKSSTVTDATAAESNAMVVDTAYATGG